MQGRPIGRQGAALAMFNQESPLPPTPQAVQRFLTLLEEVRLIQQILLDETALLRDRVRELEARGGPAQGAGRRS